MQLDFIFFAGIIKVGVKEKQMPAFSYARDGRKVLKESLGEKDLKTYLCEFIPNAGDTDLLKAYAVSFLTDRNPEVQIPEVFRLSVDFASDSFKEVRTLLINGYGKDPFSFIRFGVPLAVKSFYEFRNAYKVCRFPVNHEELSLVLVISILKYAELPEKDAFRETVKASEQIGLHEGFITLPQFLKFRSLALFHQVIDSIGDEEKRGFAHEAVKKLKDQIDSKTVRFDFYRRYYEGFFSDGYSASRFLEESSVTTKYSKTETRAGDLKGNVIRRDDRFSSFDTISANMDRVDPVDLISADYVLKAAHRKGDSSDKKDTDDPLSLGIVYNTLSSMLSKVRRNEYVVFFFASPEFIRKWLEDDLLRGFPAIFVVESHQESILWQIQTGRAERKDWKTGCRAERYITDERKEIAFYAFSDYLKDNDVKKAHIGLSMVFSAEIESKDESFLAQMGELVKDRRMGNRILCFNMDRSLKSRQSFFSSVNESGSYSIESMMFLPDNLNTAEPKSKNLWGATLRNESRTGERFCRWRLEESFKHSGMNLLRNRWIYNKKCPDCVLVPELGRKGIRRYIELEYKQSVSRDIQPGPHSGSRQKRDPIEFVPGIAVHYSFSNLKSGKINVHAYVTDGKAEIEGSGANVTLNDESEVESWIRNRYPYKAMHPRNRNDKEEPFYIQDVISEACRHQFKDKEICLKTFLYIHITEIVERIKKDVGKHSEDALKMLVMFSESEKGEIALSRIRAEDMVDFLNTEEHDADDVINGLIAFSVVLNIAKREGNVESNYVKALLDNEERSRRALANVRSKLAIKSLTQTQMYEICSFIRRKIRNGETIYAGVMIKLLTGLETRVVCALQWRDYQWVRRYGFHQLQVYKTISTKGSPEAFKNSFRQYRCIPCAESLTEMLDLIRNQLEEKGLYKEDNPLITEDYSNTTGYLKPSKLLDAVREAIRSLGVKGLELSLNDETDTDIAVYKGDFLRENFRYYAQDVGKMSFDEIAFIFGSEPETVFACHYCDPSRDSSQLVLYTKLRRIDALLESKKRGRPFSDKEFEVSDKWSHGSSKISGIQKVRVLAPVDHERDYEIEIKSDYGVHVVVDGEQL